MYAKKCFYALGTYDVEQSSHAQNKNVIQYALRSDMCIAWPVHLTQEETHKRFRMPVLHLMDTSAP